MSTAVITATTRSRRGSGTRATKLPNASRRRSAKRAYTSIASGSVDACTASMWP